MNSTNLYFVLLCLMAGGMLSAQQLGDVFEDGSRSRAENIVSLNLGNLYRGEFTLGYERLFADQRYGLEVEAGFGLGYWNTDIFSSSFGGGYDYTLTETTGGNSLALGGKRYYHTATDNSLYNILRVKNQGFDFEEDNASFRITDVGFGFGYLYTIGQRLTLDANALVFFRIYGEKARTQLELQTGKDEDLSFAIPIVDIKVGYLF